MSEIYKNAETIIAPSILVYLEGKKFGVNQKVKDKLFNLVGPIHVIGIAGKFRCGKSYILNRLFNEQNGFALGSKFYSCTKGIWIWVKKINGKNYVLLDTEGLYDPKGGGLNYDYKIVSLTLLLSSCFIMNTVGVIDRKSIEDLGFVTQITKHIKTSEKTTVTSLKKVTPNFVWLVRDFFLELENEQGKTLTDDQYLDDCLAPVDDDYDDLDDDTEKVTKIKEKVRTYFPTRKCFTIVKPVKDDTLLKKVNELEYDQLEPKFRKKINSLINTLMIDPDTCVKTKVMMGTEWTGRTFYQMAEKFVNQVNSDNHIRLDTSFTFVVKKNNDDLLLEVEKEYKKSMKEKVKYPLSYEELNSIHAKVFDICLKKLNSGIIETDGELSTLKSTYRQNFQDSLTLLDKNGNLVGGAFIDFVKENFQVSKTECTKLIRKKWKPIEDGFDGFLKTKGGVKLYLDAREKVKAGYFAEGGKLGPACESVFADFIKGKEVELENLKKGNKEITDLEKKRLDEKNKADQALAANLQLMKKNDTMLKNMETQRIQYEKNVKEMQRKFQKQMEEQSKRHTDELKTAKQNIENDMTTKFEDVKRKLNAQHNLAKKALEDSNTQMTNQLNLYKGQVEDLKKHQEESKREQARLKSEMERVRNEKRKERSRFRIGIGPFSISF